MRPVQDLAFAVGRFFARGGTYIGKQSNQFSYSLTGLCHLYLPVSFDCARVFLSVYVCIGSLRVLCVCVCGFVDLSM